MQQLRLFFAIAKNKRNCCILLDLFHHSVMVGAFPSNQQHKALIKHIETCASSTWLTVYK